MNQYRIQNIIGQGAFGNAYLAHHFGEEKDYVIKKIQLTGKNAEQIQNIFNEVRLLEQFQHVNIVAYKESIREGQELNIVMEFCAGGDLNQLILEQKETHAGKKIQEKTIVEWAAQIALAIFYMHEKRILHRDLKTPNIFITENKAKLGDFGISKVLDEKMDLASTSIGTPYYMSPQQYRHKPYSYKSDMWAFGCILYEMCNQKRPFEALSINGLAVKVLQANFAPVSEFYSRQLRDLVKRMLQKKEKDRPTILEFLQTPIIKRKVAPYLKETYQKLLQQNGDKILIEGVLHQANKLGLNLLKQTEIKKIKQEFSAQKKKQEKQRIRHQLQEQIRKLSQDNRNKKKTLKNFQLDRKKQPSKQLSVANSKKSSTKLAKQQQVSTQNSNKTPQMSSREEKPKPFKMEEDYDMYDEDYEEEDSQSQVEAIQEVHEGEEEDTGEKHQVKPSELEQQTRIEEKSYDKERYVKKVEEKSQKARFSQMIAEETSKNESQIPIQEAINNIKVSLKINHQKMYTIKNELSNLDFSISSSEDEFEKTIEADQMPLMKKKQRNPAHVLLSDKVNDLRQSIQVGLSSSAIDKLLELIKNRKVPTRTEIEKICGTSQMGAYHIANQIIKLQVLLNKIPVYL